MNKNSLIDSPFCCRWFYDWSDYINAPIKILSTMHNWYENLCSACCWLRGCWQRAFRGYADCDWWDMDYYLVKIILPMLKELRKNSHAYPGDLTEEKWTVLLDEMILGFEAAKRVCDDEYYKEVSGNSLEAINNATSKEIREWGRLSIKDQKIFKQKMKIFVDRFFNLWD